MIFLKSFRIPTDDEEEFFFIPPPVNPDYKTKNFRTVYQTKYPFLFFPGRGVPELEFSDITIFCGDNGCGKSTLLNIISEKLSLPRETPYNRSDFFEDYTELCRYSLSGKISDNSRIITSDDVFDRVLDIRRLNQCIDDRRAELIGEYITERRNEEPNNLFGLEDYDRWKKAHSMRKKSATQSQYIRANLRRNAEERSNGESALAFFVDRIADGGLYLLDEPENSLSPGNQMRLKYFIEDCARSHCCQFIISTHSPFLLSLRYAKIYDLDTVPVTVAPSWTDLEGVRVYRDFFAEHEEDFGD